MCTEPNDDTAFLNARAAIAHWRVAHPAAGLDKKSANPEIGPLRLPGMVTPPIKGPREWNS